MICASVVTKLSGQLMSSKAVLNLAICFFLHNSNTRALSQKRILFAALLFFLLHPKRLRQTLTQRLIHAHLCDSLTAAHPYSANDPWPGFANIGPTLTLFLLAGQIDNLALPGTAAFLDF